MFSVRFSICLWFFYYYYHLIWFSSKFFLKYPTFFPLKSWPKNDILKFEYSYRLVQTRHQKENLIYHVGNLIFHFPIQTINFLSLYIFSWYFVLKIFSFKTLFLGFRRIHLLNRCFSQNLIFSNRNLNSHCVWKIHFLYFLRTSENNNHSYWYCSNLC